MQLLCNGPGTCIPLCMVAYLPRVSIHSSRKIKRHVFLLLIDYLPKLLSRYLDWSISRLYMSKVSVELRRCPYRLDFFTRLPVWPYYPISNGCFVIDRHAHPRYSLARARLQTGWLYNGKSLRQRTLRLTTPVESVSMVRYIRPHKLFKVLSSSYHRR